MLFLATNNKSRTEDFYMMYNKIALAGNLTRDVEIKQTKDGETFGVCSMAVRNGYGDNAEVFFVDFIMFNKTAEVIASTCGKGSTILIDGRLDQDVWETGNGEKRTKFKVVVNNAQIVRSKRDIANGQPVAGVVNSVKVKDEPKRGRPPKQQPAPVEDAVENNPTTENELPF
jgi:single-strand DNA-binding protein